MHRLWGIWMLAAGTVYAEQPITWIEPQLQQQQDWAKQQEEEQQRFSLLQHNILSNAHFRLYNNSAYQLNAVQQKWQHGQAMHVDWEDFALSLGYGMQFFLDPRASVGYEYLSNFPYDRGQMIRIFYDYQF